ncbi:MAG: 50S ribosomal protein L11 methyltransferase [Pseudomonadota bacterium]
MYKVTWSGPRSTMESGAVLFEEAFGDLASAVGVKKADGDNPDDPTKDWTLEAYFTDPPEIEAVISALTAFDSEWADISAATVEELPDLDWVAHSLEGLGIVEAGRFVLYGVHDEDRLPERSDIVPIRIDANQAFGTGHHPTTEGCLTLLSRLADLPPASVLDLGTGSAVLAIAATKVWKQPILATDIDGTSIDIARENAGLNGVADKIRFEVADGFDHEAITSAAPFDFIFANILAGPLKEFAPSMAEHLSHNGRVMLAGLMTDQEEGVIAAYEANGFEVLNRIHHATWPCLLLVKRR